MKTLVPKIILLVIISSVLFLAANRSSTPVFAQCPTPAATPSTYEVTFPALTGPYPVGRTSYEWIDQSRDETFASIPGLKRDLMVYIWYPASTTRPLYVAPYMDGG